MKKFILTIAIILCFLPLKAHGEELSLKQSAIQKTLKYLQNQQQEDGSILNKDNAWAILAITATGYDPATMIKKDKSLVDYYLNNLNIAKIGDQEKYLMVLSVLKNQDAVIISQESVKLINYLNDSAWNDPVYLNDDIFGILALKSAGVDSENETIKTETKYILKNQSEDGGFGWGIGRGSSPDMTATTIEALTSLKSTDNTDIEEAINKARIYLKNTQNTTDAGFGWTAGADSDSATTSWVIRGIYCLDHQSFTPGDDEKFWYEHEKTPIDYLLSLQNDDGSFPYQIKDTEDTFGFTLDALLALSEKNFPITPALDLKSFIIPITKTDETKKMIEIPNQPEAKPTAIATQTVAPVNNNQTSEEPEIEYIPAKSSDFVILSPSPINEEPKSTNQIERRDIPKAKPEVKGATSSSKKDFYLIVFSVSLLLIIIQIFRIKNLKGVK